MQLSIQQLFRSRHVYLLLVSFTFVGVSPAVLAASGTGISDDYFEFKGGMYYPSERFDLSDFNGQNGASFNKRSGAIGEIAAGHYYHRYFGMEFGIGYLETKRFAEAAAGSLRMQSVPLLLSAKLFLPLGSIEPYGEIGVGGYFTKFELVNTLGQSSSDRDFNVGPHAGAGVNINLTSTFYIGFEGRFRRVRPEFTSQTTKQTVRINGYTATIKFGFRY